jgi:CheY-like chemotaxis protein
VIDTHLAMDPERRVLLVDDNRDTIRGLSLGLGALGYDVRSAFDGLTAIECAVEFRPRIVIIDIGLPIFDGWEVARRLGVALFKRPRLIALTGLSDDDCRARSLAAGFERHLVKPVKLPDLHRILATRPAPDRTN